MLKDVGGRSSLIDVEPQSLSGKPIIGYVLVQSSETSKRLFAISRPGDPVAKDKQYKSMGIAVFEQKRIVVSVDYVEYNDGTSWGDDAHEQSAGIKAFVRGWNLAMSRLRDIAREYKDPEFFIRRGILSGTTRSSITFSGRGRTPQVPHDSEEIAYETVLRNLRVRTAREAEAQEIARKLELMRTPYPKDK